ncbi:unnamed protein product [Rotaria sp. Silwood1]|nr:unnamed protein product [Rotaria sp. Silwood1]
MLTLEALTDELINSVLASDVLQWFDIIVSCTISWKISCKLIAVQNQQRYHEQAIHMPFTWTAIRLHDIFQEIVHETIISNHCNTSFANTELINSSVKASSVSMI